jgi:outer membrane murein-binding lipoprotein Lpp
MKGVVMKKVLMLPLAVMLSGVLVAGCSSKASVDVNRPVAEIAAEAKTMAVAELKKVIAQYQPLIEAKKNDIAALQSKIKEIPVTQLLGEEAKKLKGEISSLTTSLNALVDRMNVYVKELQAKGGTL